MIWVGRYGQIAGGFIWLAAFLLISSAPDAAWYAIPLYMVAACLFVAVIRDRRRQDDGG
jgi:hypothetical protein